MFCYGYRNLGLTLPIPVILNTQYWENKSKPNKLEEVVDQQVNILVILYKKNKKINFWWLMWFILGGFSVGTISTNLWYNPVPFYAGLCTDQDNLVWHHVALPPLLHLRLQTSSVQNQSIVTNQTVRSQKILFSCSQIKTIKIISTLSQAGFCGVAVSLDHQNFLAFFKMKSTSRSDVLYELP